MQKEAFAFMPPWMGSAFASRGGGGWWTLRPPALVLGHVVWLPYDKIFKAYIWKALGLWNWEAEVVSPGRAWIAARSLEVTFPVTDRCSITAPV